MIGNSNNISQNENAKFDPQVHGVSKVFAHQVVKIIEMPMDYMLVVQLALITISA